MTLPRWSRSASRPACGVVAMALCLTVAMTTRVSAASATYSDARLEVTGGPHAGSHSLRVDDVGCEYRLRPNGQRRFNVNFGVQGLKDPNQLSFVLVRIPDASGPDSPPPSGFEATVTFGRFMDAKASTEYLSGVDAHNPARKGGTGRVLLKPDGSRVTVTLDLQPQAGVTIKGTVICTPV